MVNQLVEAYVWCTSILAYPAFYGPVGLAMLTAIFVYSWQTDKVDIH